MSAQNGKPRNQAKRLMIMQYMISFATEQGRQPSVREISRAAGLQSTSTTAGYLRRMVKEGLLEKNSTACRSYCVSSDAAELLRSAG